MPMMTWGLFAFEISNLAYQDLVRRASWRHGRTSRVGARPASQFLGPDDDALSLAGTQLPEFRGDPNAMAALREMGDAGEPQALVAGTGEVIGAYVLDSVDETQGEFYEDGVPRRTDFRLEFHRVDDEDLAEATGATYA